MNILFKNARILTLTGLPIFFGEVAVEGNKISYVGDPKKHDVIFDRVIDCEGNLLMPGFKNAHAHSGMSFLRSHADDLSLHDWLFDEVFPFEAKLTHDDIYWLTQLSFLEYLTSGITSAFDMYFFPRAIMEAAHDFGFRENIILMLSDTSDIHADDIKKFINKNSEDNLVNFSLGLHAEYTSSEEEIKTLGDLIHELKVPFYTHLAETKNEVEECKERHNGQTPAEFFDNLGFWDYGGAAFHCCHMSKNDLNIFKKRDLSVVTCPGSNTKLASGVAEIETMREHSIELAIGTDGPASNNCLDMFREMFLVAGLQKLLRSDPSVTPAAEILKMATLGSAHVMHEENSTTLEPGSLADIILIDLSRPNMRPIHNIEKNLVFSGSKDNVKMTMIDGKILYENGEFFAGTDRAEIYKNCERITSRIFRER